MYFLFLYCRTYQLFHRSPSICELFLHHTVLLLLQVAIWEQFLKHKNGPDIVCYIYRNHSKRVKDSENSNFFFILKSKPPYFLIIMSDEAERTLCQLPHVHVFRIPVRKSAGNANGITLKLLISDFYSFQSPLHCRGAPGF